jgi:hypothetical protein
MGGRFDMLGGAGAVGTPRELGDHVNGGGFGSGDIGDLEVGVGSDEKGTSPGESDGFDGGWGGGGGHDRGGGGLGSVFDVGEAKERCQGPPEGRDGDTSFVKGPRHAERG